jgi:hypothetical protein
MDRLTIIVLSVLMLTEPELTISNVNVKLVCLILGLIAKNVITAVELVVEALNIINVLLALMTEISKWKSKFVNAKKELPIKCHILVNHKILFINLVYKQSSQCC